MNNRLFFIPLFVVLLCTFSCKRDSADTVIAEISLSEELDLEFREQFKQDGTADIIAKFTTKSEYQCDNGKLRTTLVQTDNNEILLNVIGLDFTETAECEGEDVAKTEINLGNLPLGVELNLQIQLLGELQTSGTIINNINSIDIDLPSYSDNTVTVEHQIVYKVPTGTAWGFISKEGSLPDSTILYFTNEMETIGRPLENSRIFGNFEIDASGTAKVNDFELQGRTTVHDGFAIEIDEDEFFKLQEIAENLFCLDNYRIRIWDTSGNTFYCN